MISAKMTRANSEYVTIALLVACWSFIPGAVQAQNYRSYGGGGGVSFHAQTSFHGNVQDLFKSKKSKFQDAVLAGNAQKVEQYVDREYVNEPIRGNAPIVYAAAKGNTRMVDVLARNGASIRRRYNGKSLAYIAAHNGYGGTAKYLVDNGGGTSKDIPHENETPVRERVATHSSQRSTGRQTSGEVKASPGFIPAQYAKCSLCGGTGRTEYAHNICPECGGSGEVRVSAMDRALGNLFGQ